MNEIPDNEQPTSEDSDAPTSDAPEARSLDGDMTHGSEADFQELADFLNPEQPPSAHAATIHRLQTDAAFAHLATPILRFWTIPLPGAAVDIDAAWAAVERKAAARHRIPAVAITPSAPAPSPQPVITVPAATPSLRSLPNTGHGRWPSIFTSPLWAIAVLLVLISGYTTLSLIDRAHAPALHYYAATGVTHTIRLADSSLVTLAPGATLVTDGFTTGTPTSPSRTVHLNGTGTFTVHADPTHPFIVETHEIAAVALGTVFNVTVQPSGAGKSPISMRSPASRRIPTGDVSVSVTSGTVVVQRQTARGHHETLAVLGPGQETSVHTFARYFKAGWEAAGAHKSVAEAYLENQAMQAADSARAATPR